MSNIFKVILSILGLAFIIAALSAPLAYPVFKYTKLIFENSFNYLETWFLMAVFSISIYLKDVFYRTIRKITDN